MSMPLTKDYEKLVTLLNSWKALFLTGSAVFANGVFLMLAVVLSAGDSRSSDWVAVACLSGSFLAMCLCATRLYVIADHPKGAGSMDVKKLKRSLGLLALGLLVAIVALSFGISLSCSDKGSTIKVGVIAPLTGDVATYGEWVRNAALLAAEDPGFAGTVNMKLVFEDSQCKPQNAMSAYRKLKSIDKVRLIIGPICSSCTFAVGQEAQADGVVLLTPVSSADNISGIGNYIFRLAPYDGLQGKIVATWLDSLGLTDVAVLHVDNDYGTGLRDSFKRECEKRGGRIVISESFAEDDSDVRTQWDNIKRSKAEAVFAPVYPAQASFLLIQRKELGINLPVFGTDPFHDPTVVETAKDAAEGVQFTDVAPGYGSKWEEFVASYVAEYGEEPNIVAAEAYDAVMVIRHILETKGTSTEDIRTGLDVLAGYNGATGLIEFNENGDCVTKTFYKYKIENGDYIRIE